MNEYFVVSLRGGDDRPVMMWPARSVEQVRALYPDALAVVAVSREDWMKLCDRMERK